MDTNRAEQEDIDLIAERGASIAKQHRCQRSVRVLLFLAGLGVTASASAVDGCKVLLCLASPNGWRNISQCVPPMEEFLRDQALGKEFPHCSMAGDAQTHSGSYAAPMTSNYYNQCPAGTAALPLGSYAIMAPTWSPATNTAAWARQQPLYAGIGDGSTLAPSVGLSSTSLPPEICVAGAPLGEVRLQVGNATGVLQQKIEGLTPTVGPGSMGSMLVPVYSSITILQPESGRNVIGVWIDGALYNQVHW